MTMKRFQKLLRAHLTAFYLQNRDNLTDWIGEAYRAASKSTSKNYDTALAAVQKALPIT